MNQMKIHSLLASAFLISTSAVAAAPSVTPSVEVTSFLMSYPRGPIAELCGRVTGLEKGYAVAKVVIDFNTNRPGTYNVLVGADGHFCTTVATYYGTAQASVEVLGQTVQATATLSSGNTR
jgi:hypothetical protein